MRQLASLGVDGIITFAANIEEADLLRFAKQYHPLVVINRFIEHPHINLLMVDNERGACLAVEHFVTSGHRHIGMLASKKSPLPHTRRVRGFKRCLAAHHLPEGAIVGQKPTIEGGFEATLALFEALPQITAVFAYNDLMAIGAMRACRALGKRIPEDIAIIGFDDIHLAAVVTPTLSSVRVDKYAIGQMAMARIFAMLTNPDEIFTPISLDVMLVLRESTQK